MAKCEPGCLCKRHTNSGNRDGTGGNFGGLGAPKCEPGCTCGRHKREDHHLWTGDDASYVARHKRLHKIRGSAKELPCVDCGIKNSEWSQVRDTDGLDVYDHYVPRCRYHHFKYDGRFDKRDALGQFK